MVKQKQWGRCAVGVAMALAVTVSASAFAGATGLKVVNLVEVNNAMGTANPQLLVQTSEGLNYFGRVGYSPGCTGTPAPSADTVKMWESLAQASLLSGKNVNIYYVACSGYNWITDIVLSRN